MMLTHTPSFFHRSLTAGQGRWGDFGLAGGRQAVYNFPALNAIVPFSNANRGFKTSGSASSSPSEKGGGLLPPLDEHDRSLIAQLLSHFKQTAEVRQYIKYYGTVVGHRFAVVKVSGDVVSGDQGLADAETERVASALAFLRRIGLVPIVVHGAGLFTGRNSEAPEVAEAMGKGRELGARGILDVAHSYLAQANASLVEALRREGVAAIPLPSGVFKASQREDVEGTLAGVVGKIRSINLDVLTSAVNAGCVPIVAASCTDSSGRLLTFPTHEAALAVTERVQPLKVIWLRPEGGLRTREGTVVRSVDLCRDAPHLVPGLEPPELHADHSAEEFDSGSSAVSDEEEAAVARAVRAEVVQESLDLTEPDAAALVELSEFHARLRTPSATVSVTAPEHLAQELFTHRGAGTLVTRGERILSHSNLATLDVPRLNALISAAFGAPLPEGYLETLQAAGRIDRIYLSEGYRGAAVVLHAPAGISSDINYLDKFAVDPSSQGDKLGEVLWHAMTQREHKLYWRSRSHNRVNPWYYEQSHGCFKEETEGWTVFWRNLERGEVMGAVEHAISAPPTFPRKVKGREGEKDADADVSPIQQPQLK